MEFPVEIEIKVPDGTPESEVEARESAEATAAGQHRSQPATRVANGGTIDPALQVVVIAVSDVDRAKAFHAGLGWRLDAVVTGGNFRGAVRLTPPGSPCSIVFGTGATSPVPGPVQELDPIVSCAARIDREALDWPDSYAEYVVREKAGEELPS